LDGCAERIKVFAELTVSEKATAEMPQPFAVWKGAELVWVAFFACSTE
jgi:hypothetical protein